MGRSASALSCSPEAQLMNARVAAAISVAGFTVTAATREVTATDSVDLATPDQAIPIQTAGDADGSAMS